MRLERVLVRMVAVAVFVIGFPEGAEAAADPKAPARRELRRRTLTIDDQTLGSLPELHVAGGSATLLTFEIPVRENGAIITDTGGLFHPPTQTDRTVILVPKVDLARPVALSVTLSDRTVLSFKLVSVPRQADVQVDVVLALKSRASPDSAQALRTTIEQLRGELDECQASSGARRGEARDSSSRPEPRRAADLRPARAALTATSRTGSSSRPADLSAGWPHLPRLHGGESRPREGLGARPGRGEARGGG
jgi:hypothetical protein